MSKNISFEEMRNMGESKVPAEVRDYAHRLEEEAATERARNTIVSYIQQSNDDAKKKQALIDALSKMVTKDQNR
jgi:hypothetical protein